MTTSITHRPKAGSQLTGAEYEAADAHIVTDVDGTVPIGGIVMWSGTLAAAAALSPTWEVCDGTANAPGPDLRDKFIVGASVDDAGAAKTNIEGSLKVSTTATGATLADHAGLTHAGGAVSDHTGLTHDGAVASHPDLTHAALSHPALTVTHADHSVASGSHTHASTNAVSVPSATGASGADHTAPSYVSQSGVTITGTATRSVVTTGGLLMTLLSSNLGANAASYQSKTGVSYPSHTHASAANASAPSATGSQAAVTLTHADHSLASLSHQAIGTHSGLTHAFTPPAGHGTAGTLTHAFTQPDNHAISAHATVPIVPAYYALALIQRMV